MTTPQIERILIQLKFTLIDTHATPEARQILALNQVNNALTMLKLEQHVARDQALHIRHTDLDQPERTEDGDVLLA